MKTKKEISLADLLQRKPAWPIRYGTVLLSALMLVFIGYFLSRIYSNEELQVLFRRLVRF